MNTEESYGMKWGDMLNIFIVFSPRSDQSEFRRQVVIEL